MNTIHSQYMRNMMRCNALKKTECIITNIIMAGLKTGTSRERAAFCQSQMRQKQMFGGVAVFFCRTASFANAQLKPLRIG